MTRTSFGAAPSLARAAVSAIMLAAALCLGAPAVAGTADHGKFKQLEGPFETGPEVTKACLGCHTEAAKQIHRTKHWTWDFENPKTGQKLGKLNVVNNFCTSAQSNLEACADCHVGYGWKGTGGAYDFANETAVDCLVCHDTTGTYSKKVLETGKQRGLEKIAASVGKTSRATCGSCHFSGGGGKAVKHGDLDPTLIAPDMFVDVHMDKDGLNFTCSTCHAGDGHAIGGSRYAPHGAGVEKVTVPGRDAQGRAACQACHGQRPHDGNDKLNDHTDRLACATCHVPEYARGDFATKTWWDWSTAGRLGPDGKPVSEKDALGNEIYNSKKGDFVWEANARPEYVWINGEVRFTRPGDPIDPNGVVDINAFAGGPDDPAARLWPVKAMRGKQVYDKVNNTFAVAHTTGKDGYWTTFDWPSAVEKGMAAAKLPYSGEFGFVETRMSWPLAHMVAPKEQAVACEECHARDSRLAGVTGIYVPGRDGGGWLDLIGWAAAGLTLLGAAGHGLLRVVVHVRKR